MAEQRTTPGVKAAMTIGGSDSSGGAGVQADLKTMTVMGVFGTSALTAVTAQNTRGVKQATPIDGDLVEAQIDAIASDINIEAVKTGMIPTAALVNVVAAAIKRNSLVPLVLDPVMIAKSGDGLVDDEAVKAIRGKLLPLAAVVTPNPHEAAKLLDLPAPASDPGSAAAAAEKIVKRLGARACIVTGVKRDDGDDGEAVDFYFDGKETHELTSEWRDTPNTHGSGCVFSAAICAALARGEAIDQAVQTAKQVVSEAIRQTTDLGGGKAPVNVMAWMKVKS